MNTWALLVIGLGYMGLLFAIAWQGDSPRKPMGKTSTHWIYALSLAVYCTSWTFYGAVGSAAGDGWTFAPIYLGPILVFLLLPKLLNRIIQVASQQNVTSIADFLAARYGKSQAVAVAATGICLMAVIPYLALQLKAVDASFIILSAGGAPLPFDQPFIVAAVMTGFAILFGARHLSRAHRHQGMVNAVAFESIVKFVALVSIGLFATWVLYSGPPELLQASREAGLLAPYADSWRTPSFWVQTLLAACAVICLPRQFHLTVVENPGAGALKLARPVFIGYLLLLCVFVVPIALAGNLMADAAIDPDTFVLALPLQQGALKLATFAYLGGLSAATAMVIVSTVATSTMVSNECVVPYLLRGHYRSEQGEAALDRVIVNSRRIAIIALMLAGYVFYRASGGEEHLAQYGLLSFTAIAQLAPPLLLGLLWQRAGGRAALLGITAGGAFWAYTLALPALLADDVSLLVNGPAGIGWLRPQALLGVDFGDPLIHGSLWSLGSNMLFLVLISVLGRRSLSERIQAEIFLGSDHQASRQIESATANASIRDIQLLLERFLGKAHTQTAFSRYEANYGALPNATARAPARLMAHAERELSGAIGSASARSVFARAIKGTRMGFRDIAEIVGGTAGELNFSRRLLGSTLENVDQGVSVVDQDLRVAAWNQRYIDLFEYPDGFILSGKPIAEIIRFNAERGLCGPGDVETHVARRVAYLKAGTPYQYERIRADGTVIEIRGRPMPGGGFVASFSDITEHKRVQSELRGMNESLETLVAERTRELNAAKRIAEQANASKTRFLDAASHDLLQPLNAAKLFASALAEKIQNPESRGTLSKIDGALVSAEEIIATLIEVSRIDARRVPAEPKPFDLGEMIAALTEEFKVLAAAEGLELRYVSTRLWTRTDRKLLRRILQNFLSNAIRYTPAGRVLIGCRRRAQQIEIQVWDTGPGIPLEKQDEIFEDFKRLHNENERGTKGLGLGLSIARRLAQLLGHRIRMQSYPGRGSMFCITVPAEIASPSYPLPAPPVRTHANMHNLRVLCVDNDEGALDSLAILLRGWGVIVHSAYDGAQAMSTPNRPDILLLDYRLDEQTGIDVYHDCIKQWGPDLRAILITAERSEAVRKIAQRYGITVLHKPLKPAALRAVINRLASVLPHKLTDTT